VRDKTSATGFFDRHQKIRGLGRGMVCWALPGSFGVFFIAGRTWLQISELLSRFRQHHRSSAGVWCCPHLQKKERCRIPTALHRPPARPLFVSIQPTEQIFLQEKYGLLTQYDGRYFMFPD
jgi:hypothetical protein